MTIHTSRKSMVLSAVLALSIALLVLVPRSAAVLPCAWALAGFAFMMRTEGALQLRAMFFRPGPLAYWLLAIAALMLVSGLWSVDPAGSFSRALKTLPLFVCGWFLWTSAGRYGAQILPVLRRVLPVALGFAGAVLAFEHLTGGVIYKLFHDLGGKRLNFSEYNRAVVTFMFLVLPAIWACLPRWRESRAVMANIALLLACAAILLVRTESQSAQLALFAGLACLFFPVRFSPAWRALGAAITLGVLSAPLAAQYIFHAMAGKVGSIGWFRESSAASRMEIWDFVARRAMERPLFGHGIEATKAIKAFDTAKLFHPATEVLHPHNFILQVWIETGLLGAALLCAFMVFIVNEIRMSGENAARLYLCAFIPVLVVATTGYGLWQGWWIGFFFILAAICRLAAAGNEKV